MALDHLVDVSTCTKKCENRNYFKSDQDAASVYLNTLMYSEFTFLFNPL
jgi:hypothetical protein